MFCRGCGNQLTLGAPNCSKCGEPVEPVNSESNPKPSRKLKLKYPLLFVFLIIASIGGYFGWQWNETRNYTKQITPLFYSIQSLQQDINNTTSKAGRYIDLVDEVKRMSGDSKSLRRRIVENIAPNAKSTELQAQMNKLLDIQSQTADSAIEYLRCGWDAANKEKTLEIIANDYYIRVYAEHKIAEAQEERAVAKNKADFAQQALARMQETYLVVEKETIQKLGLPAANKSVAN